jgi:hypothetical protein
VNLSAISCSYFRTRIVFLKKNLPGLATMFQDIRNAAQLREVGSNMLWKDISRTRFLDISAL